LDLIRSKTCDYLFANVEELKSLYETDTLGDAVQQVAKDTELATITMGADGAMVISDGEIVTVPAYKAKVDDLTGAGDLFASGFLLGHSRGQTMEEALKLGCLSASEVISHIGARPLRNLKELAAKTGLEI